MCNELQLESVIKVAGRKGAIAEWQSAEIQVKEKVKNFRITENELRPPPEEVLVYNAEIDDSIRSVESPNMWFLRSDDPVLIVFSINWYFKNERINWKILIKEILEEFLNREGYL